jgi:hypothetical protein
MKEDSYAKQWRFHRRSQTPNARAVQVAYWALTWPRKQGKESAISATVQKAAKMGDYLRYAYVRQALQEARVHLDLLRGGQW